ncbi:hypothetical protein QYE76_017578 [Lolium multiflorum]|uniref:Reverse transcriptase domain-containing protein n=1 Tax=Lolium multiflorum TaxID=4521 RepID=A0AAD8VE28_LOLMU|nr:hypothetical protein QYE76_017578 [Lolium multiflorum]
MVTAQERKNEVFTEEYERLIGSIQNREHTINLEALNIPVADLGELEVMFTEEEVWNTIREMPSDRAPGLDGFTGAFFQRAWPTIKHDILAGLMKLGVGDGRGFARHNRALITLIPKKPDALEIKDYRPISLVHSFAKLFSKVIANRLRSRLGEMVSMNQSAFFKLRSLHDNFVLVRQVARKINMRRRTGVLLKLDIARAFDSISRRFLFEVLRKMGFGERYLKWVALLLYTANTKVMVNGVPGNRIYHGRGLRQGDPTSPMLFVAAMEALTAMVIKAMEEGLFGDLASISSMQRISVYADDVVLFLKPVCGELWAVKHILSLFGEATGLHVNFRKTTATMIRGTREEEERTSTILGCDLAAFSIRYLGLQLALRPLTKAEWQPLLDQVTKSVPTWQRGLVWCRVLRSANLRIADPGYTGNLQRWWTEARKRVRRIDRKRFDSMVISTTWTLWKQRNARAFGNEREQKMLDQMFPKLRKSKLLPRGDGAYKVLAKINDNAYSIDLPSEEFGFSNSLNVADLTPYDGEDLRASRSTPFEGGGDDEDILTEILPPSLQNEDDVAVKLKSNEVRVGSMRRARMKKEQTSHEEKRSSWTWCWT